MPRFAQLCARVMVYSGCVAALFALLFLTTSAVESASVLFSLAGIDFGGRLLSTLMNSSYGSACVQVFVVSLGAMVVAALLLKFISLLETWRSRRDVEKYANVKAEQNDSQDK